MAVDFIPSGYFVTRYKRHIAHLRFTFVFSPECLHPSGPVEPGGGPEGDQRGGGVPGEGAEDARLSPRLHHPLRLL